MIRLGSDKIEKSDPEGLGVMERRSLASPNGNEHLVASPLLPAM
jgi:hypothetical protein